MHFLQLLAEIIGSDEESPDQTYDERNNWNNVTPHYELVTSVCSYVACALGSTHYDIIAFSIIPGKQIDGSYHDRINEYGRVYREVNFLNLQISTMILHNPDNRTTRQATMLTYNDTCFLRGQTYPTARIHRDDAIELD
ncbi:hypothetical protein D1872_289910 [compost metagenome]